MIDQVAEKGRVGASQPSKRNLLHNQISVRSPSTGHQRASLSPGRKGILLTLLLALALLGSPASAGWGGESGSEDAFVGAAQRSSSNAASSLDTDVESGEKKISAMNVLLPISTCAECRRVRFELQASNGCYTWHNSHPQLITMTDAYGQNLDQGRPQAPGQCVDRVFIEAKTLKETKSIVQITARDTNSGTVLKCNAKVGQVDRLEIFTRSKQFSVHSNWHLTVVGYDDDDNIFSTMDGFRFDWSITEGTDIIKKFAAADTGSRYAHHTDYFLIRSLKPGFASVAVRLEEPGYEHIKLVTKKLTVVDPFIIQPAQPVYILPTSEYQFGLAHLDMEKDGEESRPIKIPNAQYKWSTEDSQIGSVKDDGIFASKVTEGEATIMVVDQQMKNNTAESSIHVVYPYRLEVTIKDVTEQDKLKRLHAGDDVAAMQAWSLGLDMFEASAQGSLDMPELDLADTHILIEEHVYKIKMHLFDKDGHRITLTDNLRFKALNLDATWIELVETNSIGSELLIKTKKIDSDTRKVNSQYKLDDILSPYPDQKFDKIASRLTQEKELVITKPVKIQHPTNSILLPFLPAAQELHGNGEIWNLHSKGGSGTYMWSIIDTSVATVQGSAQVRSVAIGKTQLVCRDHKNHNNWDAIDIEVSQIGQLSWLEELSEVKARPLPVASDFKEGQEKARPLGESRVLSLIAFDVKGRKFTNCTAIRPTYEVRGDTIISTVDNYDSIDAKAKYDLIKGYVKAQENQDLIELRQLFDEQTSVTFVDELKREKGPLLSGELMRYNNFGICAQQQVRGESEGLARVKASFEIFDFFNGPGRVLQSEFAEVAVYNALKAVAPTYKPYMADLYSLSQLGQELQNFETFYTDWQFSLQFGSSIVWKVDGGSNFWPDQAENYMTKTQVDTIAGKSASQAFTMKTIGVYTAESEFEIRCLTPENLQESQRVMITLNQASRAYRQLLRPAQHSVNISLHCEPPQSVKLLWAQDYLPVPGDQRALKQLPRSRLVHNTRTHYVLVNSRHSVRYLMLDSEHKASLNSTSVVTNVRVSNPEMATVSNVQEPVLAGGRTYAEDSIMGLYDKRTVQFRNITGKVYLTAESSHYLQDYIDRQPEEEDAAQKSGWFGGKSASKRASKERASSVMGGDYQASVPGSAIKLADEPLKNNMLIEVVRNVDVEPKFKSLYIGTHQQTYKLRILHGSGAFSVTVNDTRLVDFVQKDREIHITPKALGGLKISVEDLELPSAEVATAELLISDIAKLSLWAPLTLIEKGDQMQLTVSAFDSFMNEFQPDQYALMHFNIETETMGLRRTGGLQSTQVAEQNRKFDAYGREAGVYQLTAFTFAFHGKDEQKVAEKSRTIVSEMVRIEVFPILEIYPNNLLITPNMRYTLQIVGGPQTSAKSQQADGSHIEIKFEIENKEIATIDRFREVTGHEVGDAILKYEIIQLRQQNDVQPLAGLDQDGKGVIVAVKPQSRVVSKKTVKIRVRLVTDIEIPYTNQRQIFAGSLVKMMAVLKYNDELFHHGIAPISYSWNCTEGRVLALDLPSKQDLAVVHGVASNFVMTSRYVRDNIRNRDKVEFFTSFNSSSVYANGEREGEALVTALLAIEYPDKYRNEQNWFKTSANVKVTERLTINVPQYSTHQERETHMYLVPPHTLTKIETNKQTRLKLGYSQQSVFDYSTQQYKYQEATSPIISIVNDEAIRTSEKYGKVTLFVEEGGAFSDQIVMLNVKIADIYTLAAMRSYDALSLPLGSSLSLPLHLQDDHGHMFAEKISGIGVGIHLSHPKVIHASLDQYNQTLTVQSLGSGDCNVFLFLEEHPHIFDVIRVRVSGVVQPLSPVFLHTGGEINFRVESSDSTNGHHSGDGQPHGNVLWSSSSPNVLAVDPQSGKAHGKREGKADVMLSNHLNAASIVHVSKVAYAQLDQKSSLIINTDDQSGVFSSAPREQRVRIKFFLDKQVEEMMPTVQFDGLTLIRQNIGIDCESDNPDYVLARGEVNDLEGFFCVVSYVSGASHQGMPRFVKISVSASGRDEDGKQIYSQKVADFEMQLISEIVVESKYAKGVELCHEKRTQDIKVFSSSEFKVDFKYVVPEEHEGQLVLHSVAQTDPKTNEYTLKLQVPVQVSHAFDVQVILSHQFASKPRSLILSFDPDRQCSDSNASWLYSSQPTVASSSVQQTPDQSTSGAIATSESSGTQDSESQGGSLINYLVFFAVLIAIGTFLITICFDMTLNDLYILFFDRQRPVSRNESRRQQQYSRYQNNLSLSGGDGVRSSRAYRAQPVSRDYTVSSFGKDLTDQSAASAFRKGRTSSRGQPQSYHFDNVPLRRNTQQHDQSAQSNSRVFDRMQDSPNYY